MAGDRRSNYRPYTGGYCINPALLTGLPLYVHPGPCFVLLSPFNSKSNIPSLATLSYVGTNRGAGGGGLGRPPFLKGFSNCRRRDFFKPKDIRSGDRIEPYPHFFPRSWQGIWLSGTKSFRLPRYLLKCATEHLGKVYSISTERVRIGPISCSGDNFLKPTTDSRQKVHNSMLNFVMAKYLKNGDFMQSQWVIKLKINGTSFACTKPRYESQTFENFCCVNDFCIRLSVSSLCPLRRFG